LEYKRLATKLLSVHYTNNMTMYDISEDRLCLFWNM